MATVTLQITWDISIDDIRTNYIHMGKNKILLLPQTIQDTVNKILWSNYHGPGTTFIIKLWVGILGAIYPFINILYPCLPGSLLSCLDY